MRLSATFPQVVNTLRRYGLALLAFALVLLMSFERYHSTVQQEQETTHTRFQLMAQEQIARLRERTDELFAHADLLRRYVGQGGDLGSLRFARFLTPILAHNPEIAAAGLIRRAHDDHHVDVLQVAGATRHASGSDFLSADQYPDAGDRQALREALRNAPHSASDTTTLPVHTRDVGGSPPDTILILAPLQDDSDAGRDIVFLEVRLSRLLKQL